MWRIAEKWRIPAGVALASLLGCSIAAAAAPQPDPAVRSLLDIPYASVGGHTLVLDLHMPVGVERPPLVVYLHGGAWRLGDKEEAPPFLVKRGYAVASLNFRSSEDARFPANVHDIKAGIRFLRARAGQYGYRADRIAVSGSSSGGHLAALVGLTNGHPELEGSVGAHAGTSSGVQAVVAWVGAYNLATIIQQSTPEGLKLRVPAVQLLLGGTPEEVPDLARLASPVAHVDRNDPPLLLLHGNQDLTIPVNQPLELDAAYRRAGLVAELVIVDGVGHVARPFFGEGDPADRVIGFLQRTLGQ